DVGAARERAVVVGWLEVGALALTVAARHPDRVTAVVAGETMAVGHADAEHPWGLDPAVVESVATTIETGGWGQGSRARGRGSERQRRSAHPPLVAAAGTCRVDPQHGRQPASHLPRLRSAAPPRRGDGP